MKFDCGETWLEKKERLSKWHKVFAYLPKRVDNHDCRWWEYVERKGSYCNGIRRSWWHWKYRAIDKGEE